MKRFTFSAKIEAGDGGGMFVFFPHNAKEVFGKGRVPVLATIDGLLYRGSLIKYGAPQWMLLIRKDIRQLLHKTVGDFVAIELWEDTELREVEIPDAVKSILDKQKVLSLFQQKSYSQQREWVQWVAGAKRDTVREKRIATIIQILKETGT
ncbi:MAG: YdeI/OmpD-associated family protein [Chitinophagales bacterium]